jgi:hypothetical protein
MYWYKCLLALDLFAGAVLFRDYNVTISAQTGLRMRLAKPPLWARVLSSALDRVQAGHCEKAIHADIARAKGTIAYLGG